MLALLGREKVVVIKKTTARASKGLCLPLVSKEVVTIFCSHHVWLFLYNLHIKNSNSFDNFSSLFCIYIFLRSCRLFFPEDNVYTFVARILKEEINEKPLWAMELVAGCDPASTHPTNLRLYHQHIC